MLSLTHQECIGWNQLNCFTAVLMKVLMQLENLVHGLKKN